MPDMGWMSNWYGVTGAANSSTYLRGDGVFSTIASAAVLSSGANIDISGSTIAVSSNVSLDNLQILKNTSLAGTLEVSSKVTFLAGFQCTGPSTFVNRTVMGQLQAGQSSLTSLSAGNSTCVNLVVTGGSTLAALTVSTHIHTLGLKGSTLVSADGSTHTVGTSNTCGTLFVTAFTQTPSTWTSAIYALKGAHSTTAEISDPDNMFEPEGASSGGYDIHWDSTHNTYQIKNKVGNRQIIWHLIGRP